MDCRTALLTLLDSMDYTVGNCRPNEMVGALVPAEMIRMCRQAAQHTLAADVCPACRGLKIVRNDDGLGSQVCPACNGAGHAAKA